ncbi:MAG: DUF6074 family protein [Xanthobacteraceae bacterium]
MISRSLSTRAEETEPSGREPPAPPPRPPIGDAVVVPFPFAKRRAYIQRQLENVAGYRPGAARRYLEARIEDRVRNLRNAGVAEDLIKADIAPVEQIFRDGLRFMFGPRSEVL